MIAVVVVAVAFPIRVFGFDHKGIAPMVQEAIFWGLFALVMVYEWALFMLIRALRLNGLSWFPVPPDPPPK